MKRLLVSCAIIFGVWAANAQAGYICNPTAVEKPVLSANSGSCKAGYTLEYTETASEQNELNNLRFYIKAKSSGIAGKPEVSVVNANLHVYRVENTLAGTGNVLMGSEPIKSGTTLGEANIVVGPRNTVEGKETVVIGDENKVTKHEGDEPGEQSLVVGALNTLTGFGSVLFGASNKLDGGYSSILGGVLNKVTSTGRSDSICGHEGDEATGELSYFC